MENAFCAWTIASCNGPEREGRGRKVTRQCWGTEEGDLGSSLGLGTNLLGNPVQVTSTLGSSVF